ncbi:hypothetical protein [Pseudobdellovibrio sp. HCB154]|uniref:hypothetical protein n=1 Tax=Pseudobdellovibrio sp. HCB154 TaxID=3386277 RepID=UPI0039170778
MMIRFFILLSLLVSAVSAQAQHEIQIYAPGFQFRYEEGSDQSIDLRGYSHYSVNYMYQSLLLGIEHNSSQDNTGSTSLGVKTQMKEWNFLAGFSLAKMEFQNVTPNTNLELLIFGVVGQTKAEVETSLNGQSQTDTSDSEQVLGLGGLVLFRLDYFIVGLDTRYMQSKAYEPNAVSVSTVKLGVNFDY